MNDEESEEIEVVSGYLYTHADCPACGINHEREGDCQGDIWYCDQCKCKFKIGTVL